MIPTGPEALSAYRKAQALVEEGRYEEAQAVEMQPSDAKLIADKIKAKIGTSANTTNHS